jgi:hypothetical protein
LLDYLAAEFVAGDWRLKRMHRFLMTSRAYRMSSRADHPRAVEEDEANLLFWRQNLRRLEAEAVRDTILAVSGSLNPKPGGSGVFPTLPKDVHRTQDASGKGWSDSPADEQNRRSVYLVVKRALKVPLLESLDFANSTLPAGVRPVTTTAPQALMLLNDAFMQDNAAALADQVTREAGPFGSHWTQLAFEHVLQRAPSGVESEAASRLVADQRQLAARSEASDPDRAALESLCRGLLNLKEMIYVD